MAERRMFTQKIIDSDAFLDMPLSTQALYFHLNMRADDDGFVNNPKRIQRTIGASEDDLKLLFAKRFVIGFESGVLVIKHWRMHNTLRKDRYNPTQYQDEYKVLRIKDNNAYTEISPAEPAVPALQEPANETPATIWQPSGNHLATQYSIGKDSIDKKNNILSDSDESDSINSDSYKTIVDHLNQRAGTSYRASTKKTKSIIHARIKEGFTVDDFKTVIDKKCAEWLGTDMAKYLRPETLFGTKFEGYLNANTGRNETDGQNSGNSQQPRYGHYI